MQTKTLIKRVLWGLIAINGLLNPYSFLHYAQDYSDNTMNTAVSHDTEHTSVDSSAFDKISLWFYANTAHAATESEKELAGTLEAFLKVIYVLLWPLLWIAGIAMDNSLVYGEYFWLDNALFKFWSIMKNFANFALWFLFVRSIVSYVINPNEKKNPKDMITKLLVAGVWVQLSWFLIGALVDLSTVLTVGIWWLPLQLISNDSELAQKPVLWVKTSVKLNDQIWSTSNLVVLYTWPGSNIGDTDNKYLLPCYIEGQKVDFSRKWPHAFGVATWWVTDNSAVITGTNNITWNNIVQNFCIVWNNVVHQWTYESWGNLSLWDPGMGQIFAASQTQLRTDHCTNNDACQTMKTFAKSSEWYQWAFYSLYASLLWLSTIHIGVPKSTTSLIMETLIKTIVWLAYLIPLAILCIVLIMRVWYLWLIIAFSPFIILASVKDLGIKWLKDWLEVEIWKDKKKFTLQSVIDLLLLPVIVTFTISLSIVFLSSLSEWLTKWGAEATGIYSRVDWNYKCYDIAITDICIDMPNQDVGSGISDYFSWFIMNLFGVWLMWFAVMTALKSSDLTRWVAEQAQKLSESMLMNAPIVPMWWGDKKASLSSIMNIPDSVSGYINEGGRENKQMIQNMTTWRLDDMKWKDNAANKAMAKSLPDIKDTKSAANALKNVSSSFKGNNSMDFWQFDNSLDFANTLATHGWLGNNAFNHWQELFTTSKWQKLLATLLDKLEEEDKKNNTTTAADLRGDLQKMYSGKWDEQTRNLWENEDKTGILNKIDALRTIKTEDTPKPPTPPSKPYIKGAKTYEVDWISIYELNTWTPRSTSTPPIGKLDITSKEQDNLTWKKIVDTLNTIWEEWRKQLQLETSIQNILNKDITSKEGDIFQIQKGQDWLKIISKTS